MHTDYVLVTYVTRKTSKEARALLKTPGYFGIPWKGARCCFNIWGNQKRMETIEKALKSEGLHVERWTPEAFQAKRQRIITAREKRAV